MAGPQKNFFGKEGFVWFIGVVEDRNDPEKLGRVRVRCFGWHTDDKEQISTDSLPWAHPVLPINSPATYTAKEGDYVFGFFLDAHDAQNPVIVGVVPGKPKEKPNYEKGFSDPRTSFGPTTEAYPLTTRLNEPSNSRLARGRTDGTIIEKRKRNLKTNVKSAGGVTWSEPSPTYATTYPYNYAHETESGHTFELDDTPNHERVQLAHKTGTFVEFDEKGNRIEKVIKDNYTIIMGADNVYISGACNITVDGACNLKVGGKLKVEASSIEMAASGAIKMKGSDVSIEATKAMNLKAATELNAGAGLTASFSSGMQTTIQGMFVDIAGALVNLQEGSATAPKSSGLATPTSTTSKANVAANTTATANVSTTGKQVAGSTVLTNESYTKALGLIDNAKTNLLTETSLDRLGVQINGFEDGMNSLSGQILNLGDLQVGEIKVGNFNVKQLASARNIDLNLVPELLPKESELVELKLAKHTYPKTEFVPVLPSSEGIG